ncbi:MAG: phosphatase PAP2 family protein [Burkholderiales bacterium]|nr:phosphatase PAP2 family protein [Burkholderiales bacterium]
MAGQASPALAGGIDHKVPFDDSGIWKRSNQLLLENSTILLVLGGALWEGSDDRFGRTLWQSVDAMAIGAVTSEAMKLTFSRTRPSETDNPNLWFQGHGNKSFPSGEVMLISTAVTPLVLEYAGEHPAVWALELLPVYDAIARVKVHGHWQTDVLASLAIGTAIGVYAHDRSSSLSVGLLPRGVTVGWKKNF